MEKKLNLLMVLFVFIYFISLLFFYKIMWQNKLQFVSFFVKTP